MCSDSSSEFVRCPARFAAGTRARRVFCITVDIGRSIAGELGLLDADSSAAHRDADHMLVSCLLHLLFERRTEDLFFFRLSFRPLSEVAGEVSGACVGWC